MGPENPATARPPSPSPAPVRRPCRPEAEPGSRRASGPRRPELTSQDGAAAAEAERGPRAVTLSFSAPGAGTPRNDPRRDWRRRRAHHRACATTALPSRGAAPALAPRPRRAWPSAPAPQRPGTAAAVGAARGSGCVSAPCSDKPTPQLLLLPYRRPARGACQLHHVPPAALTRAMTNESQARTRVPCAGLDPCSAALTLNHESIRVGRYV